ncbi:MAG: hypothetical protein F6K50_26975 [Moorea sp. SIO3I7]|uniref:hemolysin XhlA family protein n=1 Tax=unclassified Moorena TaxID=2683338 RepID=UPI0013BEDBDE|nr:MULTISPECIES: hemolysin XhlA family protein [unclassified Moorena]NEN99004.1 hypothetical protein [Moorena sp. SIO3I7]NEO07419.1 hypothetical protein [Moorena sp. SIO3I8]NEO14956.1 hypothetical protein [Moorena sp. SIO3E8]NEQ01388.1 hypothetical protein [Moorena sp. SIO3F7]
MSETPITITYSLEEVLKDINGKLDSLQKDVNTINETLIKIESKQNAIATDFKELNGSSKAQIWTLIGILVTAVGGFVVCVGRFVISGNP